MFLLRRANLMTVRYSNMDKSNSKFNTVGYSRQFYEWKNLFSGQIPISQLGQLKNLHRLSSCNNNFTNYPKAKQELSTITCTVWV